MKVTNKRKIASNATTEMMLRGILGVSKRDHMRNEEIRPILHVSPIRCKLRHPQSDGDGNTRYQTTRTPQEDMAPTVQGRHDGCGFYPGCGPRPEGVKKNKANP